MRRTISAISAFAFVIATAAPAMAATCDTSLSSGAASVEASKAKIEIHNYATGGTGFEIWVRPRDSGCVSSSTVSLSSTANVAVKNVGSKSISPQPKCNDDTWGKALVPATGEAASNGGTQFIGRVPVVEQHVYQTSALSPVQTSYSNNNYDYRLLLDGTGKFVSFCVAGVSGNLSTGDSEFWTR